MSVAPVLINRNSPLPLYYQLKTILLERIQCGALAAGDRLPSEDDLVRQYGVSKITVRQALSELVRMGYLRREQGRGTFVARPKLEQGPRELTSFTEQMKRRGMQAVSRVLEAGVVQADADVAERLHLPEGTPVLVLKRVRLADGEPMGVQTAYLPAALVAGLEAEDLESGSLYEILRTKYALIPQRALETHCAVTVDEEEANWLGLPVGAAALTAERVSYLPDGRPLELVYSVMRADRYRIVLELVRPNK